MSRNIARERIDILAEQAAAAAAEGDDDRAREYVARARRIAERHRLPLPRSLVRFSCRRCNRYLRLGTGARFRLQDGHVVVTCPCGAHRRFPYEE